MSDNAVKAVAKKNPWRVMLGAVALGLAGAGVGFLLARIGLQLGPVRAALSGLSAWDLPALPLLFLFVLAVHEAGHLAGGLGRGMRFLLYIVGPFGWFRTRDGIRFRWCFNLGTLGGVAAAMPDPARPLRAQLVPLVLGGPLASLALAVAGAALFMVADGRPAAYGLITAALSALVFLVTAMPMRAGGFMSDGMQFLQISRNPAMVERRTRLLALMGMSLGGTRPRELDAAMLAQAQALTGDEAMYDIAVWLCSYGHALDQGDIAAAGAWLDRIEPRVDEYPDGFRQSLAVELAGYEALHRRRPDRAEAWLARARGGIVDASRRHFAEAALAAANGRREEALLRLAQAESRLGRGMDPGFARLSADQIGGLRAALSSPAQGHGATA